MGKLLFIIVLAVGAFVGDVAAKAYAESKVAEVASTSAQGAAGVSADITGFPFVPRLLATGEVPKVTLLVDEIAGERLRFAAARVELERVEIDRSSLFAGDPEVVDIGRGHVQLDLSGASLSEALGTDGVEVTVSGGAITASIPQLGVTQQPRIEVGEDRMLRIVGDDLSAFAGRIPAVGIPKLELVPCRPEAEVVADRIRLSCSFDDVPPALVRAANRGAG